MDKNMEVNTILSAPSSDLSKSSTNIHEKAASVPLVTSNDTMLKIKTSAPSYLFSLKENEAPPFKKPERKAKPKLLIGTIMNEYEAVEMIAAADDDNIYGLKKYLGNLLIEKEIIANYHLSEKSFLISLLQETIQYAAQRDFSASKLACLLTIYLNTHVYFRWYYWTSPVSVWSYFKEIMIRHTIQDSPDGEEVFEPDECYDILTHFHSVYLTNLPLVHILTFGAYRFKLLWPFKPKSPGASSTYGHQTSNK